MAVQAQVVQVTQYVFQEGKAVAGLEVKAGTVIAAGVIPDHVTELDMVSSKPVFEKGAIHPALKYVRVHDVAKDSYIPDTTSLFVHTYTGDQPLPKGPQVYVHANQGYKVSKDLEHYVFYYGARVSEDELMCCEYDHGEQSEIKAFERTIWAVKRTPKPTVLEVQELTKPDPSPVPQYCFPKGESMARLGVLKGTVIAAGVIPSHVTELDMRDSKPLFKEGAIPSTLKYLHIKGLVKGSIYPRGLHLFIRDYSKSQPLPEGVHSYVHVYEEDIVDPSQEHHLYYYGGKVTEGHTKSQSYDHGPRLKTKIFGDTIGTVKRTPRVKAVTTDTPSKLVEEQTKLAEEQTKLVQAKRELVVEKQKLVHAKLELVAEQVKALLAI